MLEAARAGRVRRVMVAETVQPDPRLTELRELGRVETLATAELDALVGGSHQGVVAELLPRSYVSLRELLARRPSLLVAVDSVQDPQNLGAILRTSEAAGVDGVILPERRAAPITGSVVKASSGASELVPLCRVPGLPSAISEVKRAGLWCVALDPRGELAPWDFDLTQPACVVVGAEGAGVHRLVLERCDARLRLPMHGRVASLNASAAAAVLLFEVVRQRDSSPRQRAEA